MTQHAKITFNRTVHQRTGVVKIDDHPLELRPTVFHADRYALLLAWKDISLPYLKLRFLVADKPAPTGAGAVREIVNNLSLSEDIVHATAGYDQIVAVVLQPGIALRVTAELDTNHPRFCRDAMNFLNANPPPMAIPIHGYLLSADNSENIQVKVVVDPAAAAPKFTGYVGLDVGNFNCTLASIDHRAPDSISVLSEYHPQDRRPHLASDAKPISSVVHLRSIVGGELNDTADSVGWTIGERSQEALKMSMNGIELAAKRLVASPDYEEEKTYRVFDQHRGSGVTQIDVNIPRRLPGELLACRMMELFREATSSCIDRLAVSYPTTFSEREVLQLREVVHRAWLRMRDESQDDGNLHDVRGGFPGPAQLANDESGVTLMLDEASAAAFFFVTERIINAPGQLSRFRYLNPKGLNLLLFDCGGGTTDIALVRACVRPNDPRKLVLTVRGRVGRRDFGGDFITECVFRLLKAKAASMLDKSVPAVPSGAGITKDRLEGYLNQYNQKIDEIIPTQFLRGANSLKSKSQMRRSMTLWRLAEKIKINLADAKQHQVQMDERDWEEVEIPSMTPERRNQLKRLTIQASEIDLLVRDRLNSTLDICNELIQRKLVAKVNTGIEEEHSEPEEVHWVVAAGAACRYPLIPRAMRERLNVPFINSEDEELRASRLTLDDNNLKHAVAKGLARVHYAKDNLIGFKVVFDSDLAKRLPFEVVYRDGNGATRILFRENSHVDSMTEPRPLFPANDSPPVDTELTNGARAGQGVTLYRRFPGEVKETAYLYFRFSQPQGIDGRLTLKYDPQVLESGGGRSPFVMTNEDTFEIGECIDLTPDEAYLHPVQRGDL